MKTSLANHPLRHSIRLQLRRTRLLSQLDDAAFAELADMLLIEEARRGACLLEQGRRDVRQFFVIEGLLKRIVSGPQGREVAMRFAGVDDMETCYTAWLEGQGAQYSIVCAARTVVATLPMSAWCGFLARHPSVQLAYQELVVKIGVEIAEHAIGLLLLDAPGRVLQFSGKHPELVERLPQKDLAAHLNLSAETLCRVSRRCKLTPAARARNDDVCLSAAA